MTRWFRAVLIFYSLLLAVVSLLFFFMMLSENVLNGMITILLQFAVKKSVDRLLALQPFCCFGIFDLTVVQHYERTSAKSACALDRHRRH